ncbi:protein THEM6 [Anopheles arabiensis]|uniref:Protein THEM6 n=6 Tax=gambiae species complex TaxID=44542 RepID=Q7QJ53_ANOGA|nr:protein THEM6 [Anopheles arabiensis]XP_040224654.1 protein THEM6 [Anopheles coluzzii]XP_041768819.1 protein THEM6 [Anopheles merus]EAA04023.3 AGAP007288-PA [Anopheles gambiae str. PEST]
MLCTALGIVLGVLVGLYGLFELHYFLRMCLCVVSARFLKKRMHILDTGTVMGLCLTNDIDTLLYHMNNARYLREIDFARVDFYERTSLYRTIRSKGGSVVQGATTIRYRRFIRPFTRFTISSRIVYWDNQSIFMEHRFLGGTDGFIHCIALCRQRVMQCSVEDVMATLLKSGISLPSSSGAKKLPSNTTSSTEFLEKVETGGVIEAPSLAKPDLPPEVAKWLEWNDISSASLRSEC